MSFGRLHNLDEACVKQFQTDGHTVVRGLAVAEEIAVCKELIEAAVSQAGSYMAPVAERDTYSKAFVQVQNLWTRNDEIKAFVLAKRFAHVAAELLGVRSVRLYHDQALNKEPGGGLTPWHQDQRYWPLDAPCDPCAITMWMPLVDVPEEVGSMTFASGSHLHGELGPWVIGDESQANFPEVIDRLGFSLDTHGAVAAGDATFHAGWTLHSAPANTSEINRSIMTIIYIADGTRVGEVGPTSIFDHHLWLAAIPEGELATGPLNPVVWP